MALTGMVLCAGLGTRLRPLTDRLPKPACPVLHQPLVAYSLALLRGVGVQTAIINTHHLPEIMSSAAGTAAAALGMGLKVSHEPTLLGTGGGLAAARRSLEGDTAIVLNGDFLYDVDLAAALAAHRASKAAATLVIQRMAPGSPHRPLYVDRTGALACLPGQPPPTGSKPWHFTGVQILEPAMFEGLVAEPTGVFETGYRKLLARGLAVRTHVDAGEWRDIGTTSSYLAANLEVAFGGFPRRRFHDLSFGEPVSPQALLEGQSEESVVGPGARIPRGAIALRSVVLPDTILSPGEQLLDTVAVGPLRIQTAKLL